MTQLKIKKSKLKIAPFGVIILCAGASSRMGRPKLLLSWGKTTILGWLIEQWRALGAAQIAVVCRPADRDLAAELERLNFPAQDRVENPRPERGMFSSILCAANWNGWKAEVAVWTIVLGDQPHLRSDTLRTLLEFYRDHQNSICQPEVGGHGGHPVVLPPPAFAELKTTKAETLKMFLKMTSCPLARCRIKDPALLLDMDTPADYIRLHDSN